MKGYVGGQWTLVGQRRGLVRVNVAALQAVNRLEGMSVFTLYDLQKTVEAISGTLLHKQNFRRLVEKGGLVEATGNVSTETGGRPARLYRFRREVVLERPAPGLRVKAGRAQV